MIVAMDTSPDLRRYALRPLRFDVVAAHAERVVTYEEDGTAIIRAPALAELGKPQEARVPACRQFSLVRATFDDLNKALTRLASSPRLADGTSLRDRYDAELARYEERVVDAVERGAFEPDYGTYVYDHHRGELYVVAPAEWHRLALVTSNSKLLTDPDGALSWVEIRQRLEATVVGVAGVSVGGNVLEGWLREARPRVVKIADPDWVELTNLNRGERMSIRHIVGSRATRFDPKNPYEVTRVSKAEYLAYEQHLVDPYLDIWVYGEGLTRANLDRFFAGDGGEEPALDVIAEEMDDLKLKVLVREVARAHRVDVLMLSDFGHVCHAVWNLFHDAPDGPLGVGGSDAEIHEALRRVEEGGRAYLMPFIATLCGEGFAQGSFLDFMEGRGEQPTASLPQSGATAMASGAIAGKELALRALGHRRGVTLRLAYDLLAGTVA